MVLREQTVVQVSSLVKDLDRTMKLDDLEDIVINNGHRPYHRRAKPQLDFGNVDRVKACMGNHLFHAVFKCRFRKVKMMLDRGFDVNMKNSYGYSILVAALHIDDEENREKMFRVLINRDADPVQKDPKHGRHVLCWAALLGRPNEVKYVLDNFRGDFDLHEKDKDGMTILHHATQAGHAQVVSLLALEFRRFGLSVDVADDLGLTPYLHARRLGHYNITRILKEEGHASPGQGDLFTFRTGREWSTIGHEERYLQQEKDRFGSYMRATILGRSRLIRGFQNRAPQIKVTQPIEEEDVVDNLVKPDSKSSNGGTKRVSFATPPSEPRITHLSLPSTDISLLIPPRSNMALSMIDMTPGSKRVDHYKRSHAETSKSEVRMATQGATIANMFGVLAQQNSQSYRPTVAVPIVEQEVVPVKEKRSTLAILFGKQNKKKAKTPRVATKRKTTREKKSSKGQK